MAKLSWNPKFQLGRVVITKAADLELDWADVVVAIVRHSSGDWGDVSEADWKENDLSLARGDRLFSVYDDRDRNRFWIITEADRSATTVLLPDDY
jgi:hypothetical protein